MKYIRRATLFSGIRPSSNIEEKEVAPLEDKRLGSLWQTEKCPEFPQFTGESAAQAVILGGGLCGLLCAYELLQNGVKDIVLLEARKLCSGTTARTTAKITAQHGLIYHKLIRGAGFQRAKQYADANRQAISRYREIIEKEKIDCDFIPCEAYLFARDREGAQKIYEEAKAARRLSLDADVVTECELPFRIQAALRFPGQARFHPLKFAYGLAEILRRNGVRIYQGSEALALDDGVVYTRDGNLYGKNILICTHYPFMNQRGLYFSHIVQSVSYTAALEGPQKLNGMYLDCAPGGDSFRSQPWQGKDLLLLGRFDHKTGHETAVPHFRLLEEEAQKLYPGSTVRFLWSAQDCMTGDCIPYIGRYRQLKGNVFLAAGFNKWGMTGCMAAAGILSRMVTGGKETPVFSPRRSDLRMQAPALLRGARDTAASFLKDYFAPPGKNLSSLKNGEGALAEYRGSKIGAYRDEEGSLHGVNPVCAHMHCPLQWNPEEHTWDCPCHGSRYDKDGKVIENPACHPLEHKGPD
jgi:glycine/D-amino acid oxidase-like deaminating enzyme/nitrite reductase/ring-hydroxylating ferredoxin subunit